MYYLYIDNTIKFIHKGEKFMNFCTKCGAEINGRFCQNCGYDTKPKDTENTNETIDQLYGLRAGLSVISQLSDEEEKVELPEVRKVEKGEEVDRIECRLEDKKWERDKLKEKVEKEIKPPLKQIDKMKLILMLVSLVGAVALILIGVFSKGEVVTGLSIMFGVLIFWVMVYLVVLIVIEYMEDKRSYKERKKARPAQIAYLKELEKEVSNLSFSIPKIKSDAEEGRRMIKYYRKDYSDKSRFVFEALEQTYAKLLDTRDWQHLDLIIFYMETGRAETMKEALQLVDRQIQTDNIIEAIEKASKQICSTIQRGMERINNTIVASAQILSAQINAVSNQLADLSITAGEMQYALKDKADVSSKQLMEDVHQMRLLADNEEIRRRNS